MRGRSGRHSDTSGTAPELLPMSLAGFHPSPGGQEETKCIQEHHQHQTAAGKSQIIPYLIWGEYITLLIWKQSVINQYLNT